MWSSGQGIPFTGQFELGRLNVNAAMEPMEWSIIHDQWEKVCVHLKIMELHLLYCVSGLIPN